MNHWMGSTRLEIKSFILKDTGVTSLDEFAANHEKYLISIIDEPRESAKWWQWQRSKINPGEGWISILFNGVEIMPLDAWTNIGFFWSSTLSAVEDYLDRGEGYGYFSDENAEFSVINKGSVAVFHLRGNKHLVEPQSFLASLLDGAQQFYTWAENYIGTFDSSYLERIHQAQSRLYAP